jgi:YidC/Oxa1 family membrane protein insertase
MIYQVAQAVPPVCTTAAATKTSSSILDPIAKPIADVLAFFYSLIPNYAVSIMLLSIVWMLIISPLTLKTTRSMLAMQKLSPELKRLQEKHRNDRQALAQAQMDLYKEHNVSPFGSCLPTLLPLPVFIALFRVIDGLSATTTVDGVKCATPHFVSHTTAMYHSIVEAGGQLNAFGLDLGKSALSSHGSVAAALPYYILLLVMMGTQYVQTAQMMSRNPAAQQNSQMAIMKYLPLLFGVICIRFPAGVVLYYAMSNICRIAQQDLMYRFDPKVKALAIKDVQEIEASAGMKDEGEASGMFTRRRGGAEPGSGRTRFRDLLGGELQKQANAREQAKAQKSPPAGKSGGGVTKSASGGGTSRGGGGGSSSAKAGSGGARSGSARPSGTNAARKANTARQNERSGSGRPGSPRPTKGTPTKASAPTRSADNGSAARKGTGDGSARPAAPAGTNGGTAGGNGENTAAPLNGAQSDSPTTSGSNDQGAPSRTGAGSGRTGAGSGRTGAQGSRNKRRGR